MRKVVTLMGAVASLVLATAGPADAESVTVPGEPPGDITSMFVNNAQRKLTVKIYGLSAPCEAKQLHASVTWRGSGGEYRASGACVVGTTWSTELVYFPAEGGDEVVDCPTFSLTYQGGAYTISIPRSCLVEAPGRMRVLGEGVDYGSAIPGLAGPTKLLARG